MFRRTFGILRQDVAIGLRMLWRTPAFAIAAIATLAIGIGANTAIFSLINATLLEPLPYPDADRIVQIWMTVPQMVLILSIPEVNLLAQQTAAFEDLAAYDFSGPGVNITGVGEPELVKALHVSAAYFHVFGARVELGRAFTKEEDLPHGGRVVVLSHGLWQRRFGGDRGLVGKTISLGNEPYLVAGVLAADFHPDPPAQIWLPLQADPNNTSQAVYIRAAARLRRGITIDQASALLKLATAEYHRQFPLINPKAAFLVKPFRETNVRDIRTALLVLFGAVLMVLLIACSNVSNLLLARSSVRQREIAIRSAMGAARSRLVALLLTENLLLSLAGGLLGLVVGNITLRALLAFSPEAIRLSGAVNSPISLNGRVLAFAAGLSIGATLLIGLLPALRVSRAGLAHVMQEGNARSGASRGALRTKSLLVVIQIALSVMLVIGAGLMIRTFAALRQVEPGLDSHRVLTMEMSLEGTRFQDTTAITRLVTNAVDRLKHLPGVIAAASTWTLPIENAFGSSFIIEGRPLGNDIVHGGALMRPVSPDFVSVFAIPIVRGRFFSERDTSESASVAVISEALARKFWPQGNPIGERITVDKHLGTDFAAPPREIVGVVANVRDVGLASEPGAIIYVPQSQVPAGMTRIDISVLPITWLVRTSVEPYSLSTAIQRALKEATGGLPVARIRSMDEVIGQSTARSDFNGILLTAFAVTSLLLASVGVYGLIMFSVEQRQHEIGIRLALGALPSRVRNMVVYEGVRLAVVGVLVGALASLPLARYMTTLVYGVKPVDLTVIIVSSLTLSIIAALASFLPAHRASRLDPAKALRSA